MKYSHKTRKQLRKAKVQLRSQEHKYFTTRRLKEFEQYIGRPLMPEIFDALREKKNVRLLDIGAGANQLIRDVERNLQRFDRKEGGDFAKRFRGVALSLTDLSLSSYFRFALSGREVDLVKAFKQYKASSLPGEMLTFEEFKAEMRKPESKSLGFARGYLRGDIEKAFERARLPKFDFIVSHFALRYVPDLLHVIEGIHNRLLVKGGKAYLDLSSGGFGAWGKKHGYWSLEAAIEEINKRSDSVFEVHRDPGFTNHFILTIEKKADKIKFPFKLVGVEVEKARTTTEGTVKRKYKTLGRRRAKKS